MNAITDHKETYKSYRTTGLSNLLAMAGRIDFIRAVLEAINYLVF